MLLFCSFCGGKCFGVFCLVVDAIEFNFHSHFFKQNLNRFAQLTPAHAFVADAPMLVEQIDCRPAAMFSNAWPSSVNALMTATTSSVVFCQVDCGATL